MLAALRGTSRPVGAQTMPPYALPSAPGERRTLVLSDGNEINEMQRILPGSGPIDPLASGNLPRAFGSRLPWFAGTPLQVSTPIHTYSRTLLDARHSSLNFKNSA
jgi:hypothetical protein